MLTRRTFLMAAASAARAQDVAGLELKTASTHPMQYYLSLPEGWTAGKTWPVVVLIESANRQFKENTETFMRARQKMPFILVAPFVVTGGAGRWMTPENFSSSPARVNLPVKVFQAQNLPGPFRGQTANAVEIAKTHGYGGVSVEQVQKPHGPLAEEVLRYFASVTGE